MMNQQFIIRTYDFRKRKNEFLFVAAVPTLESFSVVVSSFVVAGASVFALFFVVGASVSLFYQSFFPK